MRHAKDVLTNAEGAILVLAMLLAGTGCSGDHVLPPKGGIPLDPRLNDTPANTLILFEAVCESSSTGYSKLLAANYRFTFSIKADPGLVNLYGDQWSKGDELASTSHLLQGFTNEFGIYQPAATVAITLGGLTFVDDPDHPDSTAHNRMANGLFGGEIQVAGDEGAFYSILAPQELYLVRGDAAVLGEGQEARADRWYIRRWVDRSPPTGLGVLPARNITWGSLKARYR